MKKYILGFIIIISLGLAWIYQGHQPELIKIDLPEAKIHQEFIEQHIKEDKVNLIIEAIIEEPTEVVTEEENIKKDIEVTKINNINLAVPFTSQAPTANWDQPFQDACEEASLLMVDYYYQNKQLPSKIEVESLLASMVTWQEENWWGHFNLPVAKLAEYIENFYTYRPEVIENITIKQLEDFLDKGLPVIVPTNGHKLHNPFFNGAGPEYHMLVIKGYIDNNFITNDPGTKRGEDFLYTYQNIMESIADWDTKKASATGPKNALVLYND